MRLSLPSRALAGASAAALLALLAACGGSGGGEEATPAGGAGEGPEAPLQEAAAPDPGAGSGAGAQAPDPGAPADAAVLQVRTVLAADGSAVGGVRMEAWWTLDQEPSRTTFTTDAAGEDSVLLPHGARLLEVRALATARTAPASLASGALLRRGDVAILTLELPLGASVRGVVVDALGQPVPDARVAAFHRPLQAVDTDLDPAPDAWAQCDAQGRFHLGGFPTGAWVLEPVVEGRVGTRRLVGGGLPPAAVLEGVELVLVEAHRVLGQVHDPDGRGIAGARVYAGRIAEPAPGPVLREPRGSGTPLEIPSHYVGARQAQGESDADGLFRLPAVPVDLPWSVAAFHPRYLQGASPIAPGEVDVFVEMRPAAVVEGTLRASDGAPLREAAVALLADADAQPRALAPDAAGGFLFGSLQPGQQGWLVALAAGRAPQVARVPVALDAPPLELALAPGRTLAGTLRGADGQPLAGVAVRLEEVTPEGFPAELRPLVLLDRGEARTGADGAFRWDELGDGAYRLTAYPPAGEPVVFDALRAGDAPLDLRLRD